MATVITISPCGDITITAGGECPTTPGSAPATKDDLAQAVQVITAGQAETNQLLAGLEAKVDAIYRLVRVPKSLLITVGQPYDEGT